MYLIMILLITVINSYDLICILRPNVFFYWPTTEEDILWSHSSICATVESLQSHFILTMSHWSSGLTCLLSVTRDPGSNPQGGTYVKPGFSC
jgi:hypothetical protein